MVGVGSVSAHRYFTLNGVKVKQGDLVTDGSKVVRISHTVYRRGDIRVATINIHTNKLSWISFDVHANHLWWVISEHAAWMYNLNK